MKRRLDPGPRRPPAAAGMTGQRAAARAARLLAAAGATLALLAGCAAAPSESFYMLDSAPPVDSTAPAKLTVHVTLIGLPDAVDRTPMVIRTGPNQVAIEDFHRWAEPLKYAIPRVVAADMAQALEGARVSSGRNAALAADYRVAIEVTRFESSFADGATLEAAWTVTGKAMGAVAGRTVARVPAASADPAGLASAHSQALEKLARDLAAAIGR